MSIRGSSSLDTKALQSWAIFQKKSKMLKNEPFSHAQKTCYWHTFFSKSCHSKTDKDFYMKPTTNGHKYPKVSVKESRANLSQSIIEIFKLKEWPHLIRKF